ncbi:Shadow of prion protein [Anabarilius grahami]|uniref:Shadow of prion protein n=1 Tax=Anabarilius grahami TaxID=495550 RepID=A0A3N0YTJ4_ANAGA|nr:Shadow of prion protein [Anabarilius grahami]
MNRAVATCWIFLLLSAFLCDQVMSKGGRGGARGSARGSARGGRTSRTRGSPAVRVAGAAAAGAVVALGAGGWYASAQRRPDDSSERGDDYYSNRTDWELYLARTSSATVHDSTTRILSALLLPINLVMYFAP